MNSGVTLGPITNGALVTFSDPSSVAFLMPASSTTLGTLSMPCAYLWVPDAPHRTHPASNTSGSFLGPGILFTPQKPPKLPLFLGSFAETKVVVPPFIFLQHFVHASLCYLSFYTKYLATNRSPSMECNTLQNRAHISVI